MIAVVVIALAIAVVWVVLFRRQALTPPLHPAKGPSFSDIGNEFDRTLESLRAITDRPTAPPPTNAPPTASDDHRSSGN